MKPALVMPMNDPKGVLFPHLRIITPQLKKLFERIYISIPPQTHAAQAEHVEWAQTEPFFHILLLPDQLSVGQEFALLYRQTAALCPPEQILHLAFVDRVAFALQSNHAAQFRKDIRDLRHDELPLNFERSSSAWKTHPQNYRELEGMMTKAAYYLFKKHLDFGFCHIALQSKDLRRIMPDVHNKGIAMLMEVILLLRDEIRNKRVDWLAWEDPFIEQIDAAMLKQEREQSATEVQKRLSYVIPALQMISDAAK